jgi:hypothetical protein
MARFRTPLETALETRLPLEMDDLDVGDYDVLDGIDTQAEADRLTAALENGAVLAGVRL